MDQGEFRERLARLETSAAGNTELLKKIDKKLDAKAEADAKVESRVTKIETHQAWMKGIWAVLQAPVLVLAAWYYSHKS